MNMKKKMKSSTMKCTQCGTEYTIQRVVGKEKECGHLKKVWCVKCRKDTNHVELGAHYFRQDYYMEVLTNNFSPEGEREKSLGELKKELAKNQHYNEFYAKAESLVRMEGKMC